jgi:glycosyltransferase involved in cell wall biosynthesis
MLGPVSIHAEILAGKRRAVAWGAGGVLPYVLAQCPYGFDVVIDRTAPAEGGEVAGLPLLPPSHLATLEPATTAVILLADPLRFGAEIAAEVASYGDFPLLAPFVPARDLPDLAQTAFGRLLSRLRQGANLRNILRGLRRHSVPRPISSTRRAALWVHQLVKGGAERQISLLAIALRARGWEVDLVTSLPDAPKMESLAGALEAAGVRRVVLPSAREVWSRRLPASSMGDAAVALAPFFLPHGLHLIVSTADYLREAQPYLLVSYLDDGNIAAGIAGVMAGVPNVLMSGRNAEPNVFPTLVHFPVEKPRLAQVYRALLRLPGIRLSANSTLGALSYAGWLGLPARQVPVVHNGIVPPGEAEAFSDLRARLGIPVAAPVVIGVMRLSEEKCPLLFVEVVLKAMAQVPASHAILLGDGPLRAQVEAVVAAAGAQAHFHVLGVDDDVTPYLACADVLLTTSRMEGMPNVVLEAQRVALPVVSTDAGGTGEALAPCLLPLMCRVGDSDGLSVNLLRLLADPVAARALGRTAQADVVERFSLDRLAAETLAAAGLS